MATAAPVTEIAEVPSFTVTIFVRRFDPELSDEAKWQDYDVDMYATDRVLDALHTAHAASAGLAAALTPDAQLEREGWFFSVVLDHGDYL